MPARLFLFHGSDSRASSLAVAKWERLFSDKHGDVTRYTIHADELVGKDVLREISDNLEGRTLFPVPTLIVIKRVSSRDKGKVVTQSKEVVELLKESISLLAEDITVVIWEEKELSALHPIRVQCELWEQKRMAKVYQFSTPSERSLPQLVRSYVEGLGVAIEPQAITLLTKNWRVLEKEQRLTLRLKAQDHLPSDVRTWWLYQVLDEARLLVTGTTLTEAAIAQVSGMLQEPVTVFSLLDAIFAKQWDRAQILAKQFTQEVDESEYFSFYAACRWRITTASLSNREARRITQLLASIELLIKNFSLPGAWVLQLFISLLETSDNQSVILSPRTLWLAHLQRT